MSPLEDDDQPAQAPTLSSLELKLANHRMTARARLEALMVAPDAPELPTLLDLFRRPSWHTQAACRGTGPDGFFPGLGQSTEAAKAVCAGCSVRTERLEAALADVTTQGMWGGTSERGRRELRKQVA